MGCNVIDQHRKMIASSEILKVSTVLNICKSLHRYLNLDQLVLHIIEEIKSILDVEVASVILVDRQTGELVFRWSGDTEERKEKLKKIRIPAGKGIAGKVFRTKKSVLLNDVSQCPEHLKEVDQKTGFVTKSLIAVPLRTPEKSIGVLEALNKKHGEFTENDLLVLESLCGIIAMALENAAMYTAIQNAYHDLKVIERKKDHLLASVQQENEQLRKQLEEIYSFQEIRGNSKAILNVLELCEKAINSDISVLIEGETGTGKELIARCIHFNSRRKDMPFVVQNCGSIPDTLLASELFGHKKGAFTGATTDKKGIFELAHRGTVFLDELTEMSPVMQLSLLRVLEEGVIRPLGSGEEIHVDVRIISATNRSVEDAIREGRFREDLFYRLNAFTIQVPPLRERKEDIPILTQHFLDMCNEASRRKIKGVTRAAMSHLCRYNWPGNVRELKNEVERAFAMAYESSYIDSHHLSEKLTNSVDKFPANTGGTLKEKVRELEIRLIKRALERNKGNKSRAARELGLSRYGLVKKMKRYGL